MMRFLLLFLTLASYAYCQLSQESGFQYFDKDGKRTLENQKIKITENKKALIISSSIGFGGGHGYIQKWKPFGIFLGLELSGFTMLVMGGSFYSYVQSQIIFHGFPKGDTEAFFNERYLSDDWRKQRKAFYYSSFVLLGLGGAIWLITHIVEIVNIVKTTSTNKETITPVVSMNKDGTLGLTYFF